MYKRKRKSSKGRPTKRRRQSKFPDFAKSSRYEDGQGLVGRKDSKRASLKSSILRAPSAAPDRVFIPVITELDVNTTNTSGAYNGFIMKLNSVVDPSGSLGSSQPYFFDQWATMYRRYRVHAVRIQVQAFIGATGVASTSLRQLICFPTLSSSALASSQLAMEQPRCQTKIWQINGGGSEDMIQHYVACPAIAGVSKETYRTGGEFAALINADPSFLIYYHVYTADPIGSSDVNTVIHVVLKQYVEFYGRAEPALS